MTEVTVIGLGQMGFAIANLLLRAGKSVTVWNRSAEKSAPLAAAGARVAVRAADAIAASPLVLLIVSDHAAAISVLASDRASLTLEGRTVVDLGTAGPDEVRRLGEQLSRAKASHLDCVRPRERGAGCADQGAAPPKLGQSRALRDQRNLRGRRPTSVARKRLHSATAPL